MIQKNANQRYGRYLLWLSDCCYKMIRYNTTAIRYIRDMMSMRR